MKFTTNSFKSAKQNGEKIAMLTAYDYTTAKLEDESGIDAILVGDSLGMVMLGYKDTLAVTMEDMITFGAAVCRGVKDAFVVVDMPFMSYQTSVYDAVKNAGRIMKETGADAVKLEGGVKFKEHIKAITDASIPVMGHIGMTPQSVNAFGGFKVQGKTYQRAKEVLADARAVCEAGAFSVVLECVPHRLSEYITKSIDIPTIGIGAGNECDGQVLVYQDAFAMYGNFTPKFAKTFSDAGEAIRTGVKAYSDEVKSSKFPSAEHNFKIDEEVLNKLKNDEGVK